ncbi:MAG: substrate-binding domain-containing protein [Methylobacillus sp.]|nr:substrate-binding domain-containing protein [Methylobacillus sp.]
MLKQLTKITTVAAICMMAANAYAEGPGESLDVDPETGRGGEPTRIEDPNAFRVCADQDNLPFSNDKQEGFENKIAELIAKDLGKKLEYQFWVDRFGFIRNTLNAHRCDVIIGTASGNDMMLTSKPYYRSDYVFVYRKESGYNIKDYDSPDLKKGVIGLVGMSPPTRPLSDHGLLENSKPYRLWRDLEQPPSLLIDDLVKKEIDVAIVWGPIGGYYAKKAPIELVVVPVPEYAKTNAHGKSEWNISVGVRKKEKERMAMIQEVLDRRKDDILKILDEYGIPHMPVVDEKRGGDEQRGDAIPKFY